MRVIRLAKSIQELNRILNALDILGASDVKVFVKGDEYLSFRQIENMEVVDIEWRTRQGLDGGAHRLEIKRGTFSAPEKIILINAVYTVYGSVA